MGCIGRLVFVVGTYAVPSFFLKKSVVCQIRALYLCVKLNKSSQLETTVSIY